MFAPVIDACLWNIETVLLLHSICGTLVILNKQLTCVEGWLTHIRTTFPWPSVFTSGLSQNLESNPTICFRSWFLSFSLDCILYIVIVLNVSSFAFKSILSCLEPFLADHPVHYSRSLSHILGTMSVRYTSKFTLKSNFSFQFPKFCLHMAQRNGNTLIWSLCISGLNHGNITCF